MKSWLQMKVASWNPVSHQHSGRDIYKNFNTLIRETKSATPGNTTLTSLLDKFQSRREKRNNFFHNHELAGLTVQPRECLQAFCDLFQLMEELFGIDYIDKVTNEPIIKAQIAIIRLKHHGINVERVLSHYRVAVDEIGDKTIKANNPRYEYYVIYDHPAALYDRLNRYFRDLIDIWQAQVDQIDGLRSPKRIHKAKRERYIEDLNMVKLALDTCFS
jgi:hypothetical protein